MTTYFKTSEWVSPGHPDKVADCISEYILDRIIEQDPTARYAVEVQIKDDAVSLAGEIGTNLTITGDDITRWTQSAVSAIGYTEEYKAKWDRLDTICGNDIVACTHIGQQSKDIAQGVNRDAWGDQGIFFGYYCRETENGQGIDYALAKRLGMVLYNEAKKGEMPIGLDIKTQVTVEMESSGEYEVRDVIVAIPTVKGEIDDKELKKYVKGIIKEYLPEAEGANLIINGTGAYHIHGPVGDSGTTGRKLVVDFYGSRSRIGGGSPWTKDGTKADLTLNMFAYEMAKKYFEILKNEINGLHHVETELSCCIGRQEVSCFVTAYDEQNVPAYQTMESGKVKPSDLIKKYELDKPHYFEMCIDGLFSRIK